MDVTFADLSAAAARIANSVAVTPCPFSGPLSDATGMQVYCKLEYLHRTGSFKERGARNALELLSPAQRAAGVIAASAGNHALGLAHHGRLLSIPVTVVMPTHAPINKVAQCEQLGARVILHGESIADARTRADEIASAEKLAYIHGYNDPAVIAGQGTLGLEIAAQVPDLDAIILPIGGGGLAAGVVVALKTLKPQVEIIGVEAERAPGFAAASKAGHPVRIPVKPGLADGLAVAEVGARAFALARPGIRRTFLVSEHDLALAILRLVEMEKAVVEGAGAAPLAACLAGLLPDLRGKKVVLPLTGGNIDTQILGRVLEHGLALDGRLSRINAVISDRPGGLARFSALIAEEGANIVDIIHDRTFASDDVSTVVVQAVIGTKNREHARLVRARLEQEGYPILAQRQ